MELDSTTPFNIINYGLAYVDTEFWSHHTCNGVYIGDNSWVYVLLRYDDGTMYIAGMDLANSVQLDQRFDGNFRNGGYDNTNYQTFNYSTHAFFDTTASLWYFSY